MKKRSKPLRRPAGLDITLLFQKLEEEASDGEAFQELFFKLSCIPQRIVRDYNWAPNKSDLLNAGYETLIRAIRSYDSSKCNNFWLWGERWVRKEIGKEKYREKEWLEHKDNSDDISKHTETLKAPMDLEEAYGIEEERALAFQLIDSLDPISKKFLSQLYGLGDESPQSLRKLSKEMGISPKRAWQYKIEILDTLRNTYQTVTANNLDDNYER